MGLWWERFELTAKFALTQSVFVQRMPVCLVRVPWGTESAVVTWM